VPEKIGLAHGELPAQGLDLGVRIDLQAAQVGGGGEPVRGQPAAQGPVQLRGPLVLESQAEMVLDQIAEPVQVRLAGRVGD
jgi:hypothetical protein